MHSWQRNVGVIIGLVVAGVILALTNSPRHQPRQAGPILSECTGSMRELVVHYEPASREIVSTVYRDFLGALDPTVTVHVVSVTASPR